MARSTPSLLALLGLAAVAGYQNRDKLGQMLGDVQRRSSDPSKPEGQGGIAGMFPDLSGVFQKGAAGGGIAAGLNELMERFRSSGRAEVADSWVSTNPNETVREEDLAEVLDDETLAELSEKTGLSREELVRRLTAALPETVDQLTPEGRVPTDDEFPGKA